VTFIEALSMYPPTSTVHVTLKRLGTQPRSAESLKKKKLNVDFAIRVSETFANTPQIIAY
jgi:hypothetical protein